MLHIEPLEHKDADIYSCSATDHFGQTKKASFAVTYDFDTVKLNNDKDSTPKIIEIYKFGNESIDGKLELKCVSSKFLLFFLVKDFNFLSKSFFN